MPLLCGRKKQSKRYVLTEVQDIQGQLQNSSYNLLRHLPSETGVFLLSAFTATGLIQFYLLKKVCA
jgi:hypothetical protein